MELILGVVVAVLDTGVAYEDYGISNGMKEGIKIAEDLGHEIKYRKIGKNDQATGAAQPL